MNHVAIDTEETTGSEPPQGELPPTPDAVPVPAWRRAVERFDDWLERGGERLNPILVKESRQALKSRQFAFTFLLLLLAAWGWTITAILLSMPQMYYEPHGAMLLTGYYLVLAVPMLLVVPLAAYRSLVIEVDEGTMELLEVTTLSPLQIVTGKLGSAALQMLLYFTALVPCVAFAYILRGIDLATIATLLGSALLVALLLVGFGLFAASMPLGRGGHLGMLVLMIVVLVATEFTFGSFAIGLINLGVRGTGPWFVYLFASTFLLLLLAVGVLLLAAAAQLSPPSENRSTRLRVALLVLQAAAVGSAAFGVVRFGEEERLSLEPLLWTYLAIGIGIWVVVGGIIAGESGVLTPRVRRDLPGSFVGRLLGCALIPGPRPGVLFVLGALGTYVAVMSMLYAQTGFARSSAFVELGLLCLGYLMVALPLTSGLMQLIRSKINTHAGVGVAVLILIALFSVVGPYGAAMSAAPNSSPIYGPLQWPNWVWTLTLFGEGGLPSEVPWVVFGTGSVVFFLHLLLLGRVTLSQRLETPPQVRLAQTYEGGEHSLR